MKSDNRDELSQANAGAFEQRDNSHLQFDRFGDQG